MVANLLRSKLDGQVLRPTRFRRVLSSLIQRQDNVTRGIARNLIRRVSKVTSGDALIRPIDAACELLENDGPNSWELVWAAAKKNADFGGSLFSRYAISPYSASRWLQRLREQQLADFWSWLTMEHGDQPATPTGPRLTFYASAEGVRQGSGWYWLRQVVMSALIGRGTPDAVEAIRRLDAKFPNQNLKRTIDATEEVRRQRGWCPLAPGELIDLVTGASAMRPSEDSLAKRLEEAESRTRDPKLRHKLLAVVRYNWYF